MATRTFLDSGVLIAAFRGKEPLASMALEFIQDPNRELVISDFVVLELLPKAVYHRNAIEEAYYRGIFAITTRITVSTQLVELALEEGQKTGISGMDALHVAAASIAGASELITSEKPTTPIHRTTLVRVISLTP